VDFVEAIKRVVNMLQRNSPANVRDPGIYIPAQKLADASPFCCIECELDGKLLDVTAAL
jgi:hypothetical protein